MDNERESLTALRNRLETMIIDSIEGVKVNGHPTERLPGTLNLSFTGIEGESIVLSLDLKGVAVSSGSACASGSIYASHVLEAMGIDPALAQGSIRFSLGKDNKEEDIDYVLSILPEIVTRIRSMSPLYKQK